MVSHVLRGNPDIDVELRASSRARRLTLRVSQTTGRVTLSYPRFASQSDVMRFLYAKELWLRSHLSAVPRIQTVGAGSVLPVAGRSHLVEVIPKVAPAIRDGHILVDARRAVGPQVKALFKVRARELLSEASDRYARLSEKSYSAIGLRDPRTRWGSCSAAGRLMYSWRLIMAPAEVLDYVAAHEVPHLTEMNHQPAFWQLVKDLCPTYREHRRWLRDHGSDLHRYRFDD